MPLVVSTIVVSRLTCLRVHRIIKFGSGASEKNAHPDMSGNVHPHGPLPPYMSMLNFIRGGFRENKKRSFLQSAVWQQHGNIDIGGKGGIEGLNQEQVR